MEDEPQEIELTADEKDLLNELVNEHKIPQNRLKFFYVKNKTYSYEFADIEFWLVPQKKK